MGWMECTVATKRELVVKKTDEVLATFFLAAFSEVIVPPEALAEMCDRANVTIDEVEWRDDPL